MEPSVKNGLAKLNEQSKFFLAEREFESGWLVVTPDRIAWQREGMSLVGPDETKPFDVADAESVREVSIERATFFPRWWIRIALTYGDVWLITLRHSKLAAFAAAALAAGIPVRGAETFHPYRLRSLLADYGFYVTVFAIIALGVVLFSLTALTPQYRPWIQWAFLAYLAIVPPAAFAMWLLVLRERWRRAAKTIAADRPGIGNRCPDATVESSGERESSA